MLQHSKLNTDQVDLEVLQEDPAVAMEDLVVALVLEVEAALEEEVVELEVVLEQQVMSAELVVLVVQDHWKKPYLEYQEMITQFLVMYQKPHFFVMDKLMEVIMQTLKLNVKPSTFVPMMEMED